MKEKLVKLLNLRYMHSTKWNDLYEDDNHIYIFNRTAKWVKIKPK